MGTSKRNTRSNSNSPRAYNINTSKQHANYDNSVQFSKTVDVVSLRHQRSSWAQPQAPADSSVWHQEIHDYAANTVVFVRFRYCVQSVFSVVSGGGGFSDLCSAVFWQVIRQQHAQDATSDLNEFFKDCRNFVGHWMSLQYIKRLSRS